MRLCRRVSTKYGWRMRAAIGLVVAAAAWVLAAPAAAEPISVPFVKFAGSGDEQAGFVAPAGDVNGDGHEDVIIGAPTALTGPVEYGGVAYVVFGPFVAGTTIDLRDVGDRGLVLRGSGGRVAGSSVAGAGDFNGDGLDDLLVGAPGEQGSFEKSSRGYVVFGRRSPGTIELSALGRAGITLRGRRHEMLPDRFGAQVAPLGDINDDALADVGIVASGESTASHKRPNFRPGSGYVVFGRRRGGSLSMANLGRAGFRVGFARRMYGISSAGDWNADGRPDIALSGIGRRGARVWIVYGRRYTGTVKLAHLGKKGALIRGAHVGARIGLGGLAGGEDVDGDRRPDVVIGTPYANPDPLDPGMGATAGGAWLLRGSRSRTPVDLSSPGRRAWEFARGDPAPGPANMAFAGGSTALGFVNGDRLADVVLTAGNHLAVVYGNQRHTTTSLSTLSPAEGFLIDNPDGGGFASLAIASDMDRNGHADLLAGGIGAPVVGAPGGIDGASYLLFLP